MKRKNTVKYIIVLLILSLLIPVAGFAQENEVPAYSLEELTKMALKNSNSLKSAELSKEANFDTLDNVGGMTSFVPAASLSNNVPSAVSVYKLYRNYDIAYSLSQNSLELEKDKVRNNVISSFYEVQNLAKKLEFSKKDFEYKKNMMDIAILKHNMGLISTIEKDASIRQYNMAKDSLALVNAENDKSFKNLNLLIGLNADARYNLVYEDISEISEKLTEEDGMYFTTKALANNLILEMSEKRLEMSQLNVDYYAYNDPSNFKTLNATKLEHQSEVTSFAATKEGIEKFMIEMFYSAQEMQDNYSKLLVKDVTDKELHKIKEIQYELGMITKMDLRQSENTLLENAANLAALKAGYNQLVFVLNHPHVQLG